MSMSKINPANSAYSIKSPVGLREQANHSFLHATPAFRVQSLCCDSHNRVAVIRQGGIHGTIRTSLHFWQGSRCQGYTFACERKKTSLTVGIKSGIW